MGRRITASLWVLSFLLAACGEVAPGIPDGMETPGEAPDVPRLADATVLVPSDASAAWDAALETNEPDPLGGDAGSDTGAPGSDRDGSLDLPLPDPGVGVPDPAAPGDEGPADSPLEDLPPQGPPCGPEQRPCDSTQVCVWDTDGASHCAPMAECSGRGAIDLHQLIRWFMEGGRQEMAFKVRGQPWVGKPTCGGASCAGDCCRSCWALLFLGDEEMALPLMGQGVSISCQGNECDWRDHCAPMSPGQWYWIWGRAERLGMDFRLLVDGFCPADLPPETH